MPGEPPAGTIDQELFPGRGGDEGGITMPGRCKDNAQGGGHHMHATEQQHDQYSFHFSSPYTLFNPRKWRNMTKKKPAFFKAGLR
jgi:hypothetical protein